MEKRDDGPRVGVAHFDSVRFPQVAAWTGPSQVIQRGRPAAGTWYDVLDVERAALERLVHATVFAAVHRTHFHLMDDLAPRAHWGVRPRTCSAWARTIAMVSLNSTSDSRSFC